MEGAINSGDTAWMLVCCSLVLLMTPALALFYGGMVRRKNLLSTLTLSYTFMALLGMQWVFYGYSLAFGTDINGLIGGMNFAFITPALITGAFVERVKFRSFLLFSLLWVTLIYDRLCHWVWGQGVW